MSTVLKYCGPPVHRVALQATVRCTQVAAAEGEWKSELESKLAAEQQIRARWKVNSTQSSSIQCVHGCRNATFRIQPAEMQRNVTRVWHSSATVCLLQQIRRAVRVCSRCSPPLTAVRQFTARVQSAS